MGLTDSCRCEKCQEEKDSFAWRIMLQVGLLPAAPRTTSHPSPR